MKFIASDGYQEMVKLNIIDAIYQFQYLFKLKPDIQILYKYTAGNQSVLHFKGY